MHVVKNNKRVFGANIQNVRVKTGKGVRKTRVCSACIRSGKVEKA
jgi:ribosomal protein L28